MLSGRPVDQRLKDKACQLFIESLDFFLEPLIFSFRFLLCGSWKIKKKSKGDSYSCFNAFSEASHNKDLTWRLAGQTLSISSEAWLWNRLPGIEHVLCHFPFVSSCVFSQRSIELWFTRHYQRPSDERPEELKDLLLYGRWNASILLLIAILVPGLRTKKEKQERRMMQRPGIAIMEFTRLLKLVHSSFDS